MNDRPLTRREAAEFLTERGYKTSHTTLQKIASLGGGPEYHVYGNRALYFPAKLLEYTASKLSAPRKSTSDVKPRALKPAQEATAET